MLLSSMLRFIVLAGCRLVLWVYAETEMEGVERIPERGPVLIVANHRSLADPPLIALSTKRPIYFMGKSELFKAPLAAWLLRNILVFPVNPRSADRKAIRHAESLLRAGEAVCMFPEGQLTETGEMQDMSGGAVMISLHTQAPILPIGLIGTEAIVPYGSLKPQRALSKVKLRVGEIIPPTVLTGGMEGREALMHGMRFLKDELSKLTKD